LNHFNAPIVYHETDQIRVTAREVIRRPVTIDVRVSPQDTLCDLWCTKWQSDGIFSEYFAIPLLISCYPCKFVHQWRYM